VRRLTYVAADPVLKRVQELAKGDLHKIYGKMMALKTGEGEQEAVPENIRVGFALAGDAELKPKVLKPLLFELFEFGGRLERDKVLLRKKKGGNKF